MRVTAPPVGILNDVRQRLMQEAITLFVQQGYSATTVRAIVAAAGVTKPVLYYYFKSKENLYLEIMDSIRQLLDQRLEKLHATAGSVRQRIQELFVGMLDSAHENLSVVRLAYAIYFGPPQGAPFVDFNHFFDEILNAVDALLAEGITTGEIVDCNRTTICWTLVGSYQAVLEEQFCRVTPRIDRNGLIQVVGQILDGVAPKAPQGAYQGEKYEAT